MGGTLPLQLRLLGRFEARDTAGTPIAAPGRQSVALLACLANPAEAPRTRQDLARLIWHDRGGEQAAASLRVELGRLRKAFGPALLHNADTAGASVPVLNREAADVDLLRFQDAATVASRAHEATALYRGPLLEDFPLRERDAFSDWLGEQRARFARDASDALLRLLRGVEANEAIARRLIRLDPICEEAWRYLIRRYAVDGEPARAKEAFGHCARTLARHGAHPSAETRALADFVQAELATARPNLLRSIDADPLGADPDWIRRLRDGSAPTVGRTITLPIIDDRPSIAVLPFRDLSPQPGAPSWLAESMTEETTNALARMPGFFVSARRSVEAITAEPLDTRSVAAHLGVRYLLEASIARDGGRLRSNVRLIEGRNGLHIWADTVESEFAGGMRLHETILREIVGRLQPRLMTAEFSRALSDPPANQDAWGLTMQAAAMIHRSVDQTADILAVNRLLERAIDVAPDFAMSHAMMSALLTWQTIGRLTPAAFRRRWRARRHMETALRLEPDNAFVLSACSETALYAMADIDRAQALLEAALRRDPNDANALAMLGHVRRMAGELPEAALALIEQALRLSPRDPRASGWHHAASWCYWKLADWERMESSARRALELFRRFPWGWVALTCALGLQERWREARLAGEMVRETMPRFSGLSFYVMARFMYGRRFRGDTKAGYVQLRQVLERALQSS